MIQIFTDSLKVVQICTAKMIKNTKNAVLQVEFNLL